MTQQNQQGQGIHPEFLVEQYQEQVNILTRENIMLKALLNQQAEMAKREQEAKKESAPAPVK